MTNQYHPLQTWHLLWSRCWDMFGIKVWQTSITPYKHGICYDHDVGTCFGMNTVSLLTNITLVTMLVHVWSRCWYDRSSSLPTNMAETAYIRFMFFINPCIYINYCDLFWKYFLKKNFRIVLCWILSKFVQVRFYYFGAWVGYTCDIVPKVK